MAKIIVRENDSIEKALKQFKRMCEKEGLRRDIKRSAFYEKPSEQRRRRKMQQIREQRKTVNRALKATLKAKANPSRNEQLYRQRIEFTRLSYDIIAAYSDVTRAAWTEAERSSCTRPRHCRLRPVGKSRYWLAMKKP